MCICDAMRIVAVIPLTLYIFYISRPKPQTPSLSASFFSISYYSPQRLQPSQQVIRYNCDSKIDSATDGSKCICTHPHTACTHTCHSKEQYNTFIMIKLVKNWKIWLWHLLLLLTIQFACHHLSICISHGLLNLSIAWIPKTFSNQMNIMNGLSITP